MPDILTTKSFWDLKSAEDKKIIVLEGGARSGKTWSIAQYLGLRCLASTSPLTILVAGDYLVNLRKKLLPDIKKAWTAMGIWRESDFNKSDSIYTLNGSSIFFTGLLEADADQKIHGFAIDLCWINEGQSVTWAPVQQILMRLSSQLIVDENPCVSRSHFIYERLQPRDDCVFFKSTVKDNPFAPSNVVNEILGYEPTPENYARGTADPVLWSVYGLGEQAVVTGRIFDDFEVVDEIPADALNWCGGMDFGYSIDPSALLLKAELGAKLYFHELVYMKGLASIHNAANPDRMSIEGEMLRCRFPRGYCIFADAEDPRVIDDLRAKGWWVEPVVKGKGSVLASIEVMKRYKIAVTRHSVNLIKELEGFKWQVDRNGEPTGRPVGGNDHLISAARYASIMSCGRNQFKTGMFEGCRMAREYEVGEADDWNDVLGGTGTMFSGSVDLRIR